jgi:hypothetical protein
LDALEKNGFGWIFKLVNFLIWDPKEPLRKISEAVTGPAESRLDKREKQNDEILAPGTGLSGDSTSAGPSAAVVVA